MQYTVMTIVQIRDKQNSSVVDYFMSSATLISYVDKLNVLDVCLVFSDDRTLVKLS